MNTRHADQGKTHQIKKIAYVWYVGNTSHLNKYPYAAAATSQASVIKVSKNKQFTVSIYIDLTQIWRPTRMRSAYVEYLKSLNCRDDVHQSTTDEWSLRDTINKPLPHAGAHESVITVDDSYNYYTKFSRVPQWERLTDSTKEDAAHMCAYS